MRTNKNDLIRFGSKSFILTAAIIIILGGVISSTVAWMFIKSEPVNNTFTYGDIVLELTETDTKDNDDDKNTNHYSFTTDGTVAKDPMVTVTAGSEACWLFVKIEESANFDDFMTYTLADGWTSLEDGVYYRQVATSASPQQFEVLQGNVVSIKNGVTQAMLNKLEAKDYPTLKFTAYAVQQTEVETPQEAWELVK